MQTWLAYLLLLLFVFFFVLKNGGFMSSQKKELLLWSIVGTLLTAALLVQLTPSPKFTARDLVMLPAIDANVYVVTASHCRPFAAACTYDLQPYLYEGNDLPNMAEAPLISAL